MTNRARELGSALERYAVTLARGAGEVVLAGARRANRVDSKSTSTDLVTDVDRDSERWLVARIAADRPDDAVLGEEDGSQPGSSGVRWIVDPIDGTVNFVLGLPAYAVSVAAEVDGVLAAGVVYNPSTRELFRARLGGGAWLDRDGSARPLAGPRDVPLARAVVGTGFGYEPAVRARQGRVVAELLPLVADVRRFGSAALDLCAVAAGRLDAYFESGLHPWDFAAGALIATEAGCAVGGPPGEPPNGRLVTAVGAESGRAFAALLDRLGAHLVREPD